MTMGNSWGYNPHETEWKEPAKLVRNLVEVVSKGGNYLLNVGPQADGTFPPEAVRILRDLGPWYHRVRESYVDAEPASQLSLNRAVLLTRKGDCLYVHLGREPASTAVGLKPLEVQPIEAILLNTGAAVEARVETVPEHWDERPYLRLRHLPVNELADQVLVVRLRFAAPPT